MKQNLAKTKTGHSFMYTVIKFGATLAMLNFSQTSVMASFRRTLQLLINLPSFIAFINEVIYVLK